MDSSDDEAEAQPEAEAKAAVQSEVEEANASLPAVALTGQARAPHVSEGGRRLVLNSLGLSGPLDNASNAAEQSAAQDTPGQLSPAKNIQVVSVDEFVRFSCSVSSFARCHHFIPFLYDATILFRFYHNFNLF